MPVSTDYFRMIQEEVREDNPQQVEKERVRKNLFDSKVTPEDKKKLDEQLQEVFEEGRKKLENYEIIGIIKPQPPQKSEEPIEGDENAAQLDAEQEEVVEQ